MHIVAHALALALLLHAHKIEHARDLRRLLCLVAYRLGLEGNQNKNNCFVIIFYDKLKSRALFSHLFRMEKSVEEIAHKVVVLILISLQVFESFKYLK